MPFWIKVFGSPIFLRPLGFLKICLGPCCRGSFPLVQLRPPRRSSKIVMPQDGVSPDYASAMYGRGRRESRPRSRSRRRERETSAQSVGASVPAATQLPSVESTDLSELFWVQVEPNQASPQWFKSLVLKLSEFHMGHGSTRTEPQVLTIANYLFDVGVHDLQAMSTQTPRVIEDSINVLSEVDRRVLRDLTNMVESIRGFCLTKSSSVLGRPAAKSSPRPLRDRDQSARRSRSRRRRKSVSRPRRSRDDSEKSRKAEDDAVDRVRRDKDLAKTVAELLSKHSLSDLDMESLPDPKIIVEVWNVVQRTGSPYLSSRPLEEFVPSYILQGLSPSEKTKVVRARQEKETVEVLMETVMAYWLSHSVVGVVQITAVVHHMQLLVRMLQKKTVAHVHRYSRVLPAHVASNIARGRGSVAEYLVSEQTEVHKKAGELMKSTSKVDKPKKKSRSPKRSFTSGPKPGAVPVKDQVCLKHDLAQSRTCPKADNGCPRVHLDTRKSDEKKKYDDAAKIVRGLARRK